LMALPNHANRKETISYMEAGTTNSSNMFGTNKVDDLFTSLIHSDAPIKYKMEEVSLAGN
jgi:hypothetical protein